MGSRCHGEGSFDYIFDSHLNLVPLPAAELPVVLVPAVLVLHDLGAVLPERVVVERFDVEDSNIA